MKRTIAHTPITRELLDDCSVDVLEFIRQESAVKIRRLLFPWEFPDKPVAWNVGRLLPRPLEWVAARIDQAA